MTRRSEMFGGDLLKTRTEATPDRTALELVETDREWSYRQLDHAVDKLAGALDAAATTNDQQRIAVALPPGISFVCSIHSALRLGWELVPLNSRLSPAELAVRLDRLAPDSVLCGEETEQRIVEAAGQTETAPVVHTVDEPEHEQVHSLPSADSVPDSSPHAPDETALILFTSGTTGEPKGVQLTPRNVTASAIGSAVRLGVTPADRWLCCLPMYHMGGLAPVVRSALYGTTLVIQPKFEAEATAELLDTAGITGVSLVPTQLSRLLEAGFSGPDLRTVLLGGAPASESLLDQAAEAGIPVSPTYGLTETASQVATARPDDPRNHRGTVGQPLFGTRVTIVDQDDTPVGPGERGEIVVSGPTVTPGYLDPDRTAAATSELGLHTGDLGYRNEDGRLWVLGRTDDTIITGGELVAPATVTAVIRSVPGVSDVAVVGIDDEEWGERVAALLVADSEAKLRSEGLIERVKSHCRDQLAGYKIPREMRVVDSLPRTQSGTVDRERARDVF